MEAYQTDAGDTQRLGKYRLVAELGRGGMAKVYLAVTQGPGGFNKLLVIKQICSEFADDPDFVTMFLDEAKLAARLRHPNVVQTNEVGEINGRHFMTMEYLNGQPLSRIRQRLWRAHAMPLTLHLRVLIDALAGLHHAHELTDYDGTPLHVVHRDATPENIFVTYDGLVKVVDFGIAKAKDTVTETQAGTIKGKISYMAPEQALGLPLDRRTDIFAVGVMLWEAATGTRMWRGLSHTTILQRIIAGDIPSPRSVDADIPNALDAIIRKATAADRDMRYATAAELQSALEGYLEKIGDHSHMRDLGRLVSTHFENERAQIRHVVEEQLRATPQLPLMLEHPLPVIESKTMVPENSAGAGASAAFATDVRVVLPPQRPRQGLLAAVIFGSMLAMGGTLTALARRPHAAPATATPVQVAAAEPSQPVRAMTAKLSVYVEPQNATIFLDDELLTTNPFTGEYPVSDKQHRLRVEAPGYLTRHEQFAMNRDRALEIVLPPLADNASAAPAQPPSDRPIKVAKKRHLDNKSPYR